MPKPEPTLNVRKYNRYAWDQQVDKNNPFTIPVSTRDHCCSTAGVNFLFF